MAGAGAVEASSVFTLRSVEILFVDDGVERRLPLGDARQMPFEAVRPVRAFRSFRGQRNNIGLWWSATMGAHVGFGSWLERDQLMLLDFDPAVAAVALQPFWLSWSDGDARRAHAPDFFVRGVDGAGVVVDCRPADRVGPRDEAAFEATARACELIGWGYPVGRRR